MKWIALTTSVFTFGCAALFGYVAIAEVVLWFQVVAVVFCIGFAAMGTWWCRAASDEFYWAKMLRRMRDKTP